MNFDEYGKRTDLIQKTLLEYCIDLLDNINDTKTDQNGNLI